MTQIGKISPDRVAIVCQCDAKEPFLHEVEYLFRSLTHFGGELANCQKFVSLRGNPDINSKQKLSNLGITIRQVEQIDSRDVFATKIRNLEIEKSNNIDYIISLDVDILIAKDFSKYFDLENICAKPADMNPLNTKDWELIFDYFQLEMPKIRYKTHFNFEETIPYFNTGVLLIPKKHANFLYKAWIYYVKNLLDSYKLLPEQIQKQSHFNNQFAFTLALCQTKLSYKDLPLEMNFPTHHPINSAFKPQFVEPYLIHHHHQYSQKGYFLPSLYSKTNRFLNKINKLIDCKWN